MGWFRNYIYTTPGLDCFYKLQQERIMFIMCTTWLWKNLLSLLLYTTFPPPLSFTPLSLLLYPLPLYPSSFILYPFIHPPLFSPHLSLLLYPLPLHPSSFILYPFIPLLYPPPLYHYSFILYPFIYFASLLCPPCNNLAVF